MRWSTTTDERRGRFNHDEPIERRHQLIQRLINVWAAVALAGALAIGIAGFVFWSRGFEARSEPSGLEANVAMKLHDSSIPRRYEALKSPISSDQIDLIEAGAHYEEHCSACHADDGSRQTKFHGIMNPRPTDLRSEDTQEMSDGELYWVIKNGVRWAGMPAFGKPGDDDEHAWKIVAFVRHLPHLTPIEEQQMKHPQGLLNHTEDQLRDNSEN